jgi:hypothetical protein
MRALQETRREPAELLRTLELQRQDDYLVSLARRLEKGDLGAIDRALRIQERRAKLLGLDLANRQPATPVDTVEAIPDVIIVGGTEEEYVAGLCGVRWADGDIQPEEREQARAWLLQRAEKLRHQAEQIPRGPLPIETRSEEGDDVRTRPGWTRG